MAKRLKLRKGVYYIIGVIILIICAAFYGINRYKDHKYKETYEYKLLNHGYNEEQVKKILDIFTEEDYNFFLKNKVNEKYLLLTEEKYFLKKKYYDYIEYMNNNKKIELSDIVIVINTHLNEKKYQANLTADTKLDTNILVNKYYLLPSDYEPNDLVTVSQKYSWGSLGSQKLKQIAYDAFLEMWNDANNEGFYLMINFSYFSYSNQDTYYNNLKKARGEKYADSNATRAGASEHQTGLAMDIFSKQNSSKATFKDTDEAKWLKENAHKYGFILRYPEDKTNITGFAFEPWHYRYVGKDIAKYIYENDITFDEYYAYYIEK